MLAITLLLITWYSLSYYPRYIPISSELVQNASFSEKMQMWAFEGRKSLMTQKHNTVSLKIIDKKDNQRISQSYGNLPAGSYRVTADLQFDEIIQGKEPWQNAGIIIATYDENGIRNGSYNVFTSSGSFDWHPVKAVIKLNTSFETRLIVRMLNAPGELSVRNISLQKVMQSEYYNILRWVLITLWSLMAVTIIISIRHLTPSKVTLTLLLSTLFIALLGTLAPKHWVLELSAMLATLLPTTLITATESFFQNQLSIPLLSQNAIFSKVGHFLVFLMLSIVTLLNFWRYSYLTLFTVLLYVVLLTETLQLLTQARSASMIDVGIDIAGILLGFFITGLIRLIFNNKHP